MVSIKKGNNMDIVAIKNAIDTIFHVVTHEGDRKNIERYVKTAIKDRKQNECDASTDADINFLGLENVVEYVSDEAYGEVPF